MIPVHELLTMLGENADAIAIFLGQNGFRGLRGVGEDCPLANYLKANGIADPALDTSGVTYFQEGSLVTLELSEAAADFVMLFDDGAYPDLEVEP